MNQQTVENQKKRSRRAAGKLRSDQRRSGSRGRFAGPQAPGTQGKRDFVHRHRAPDEALRADSEWLDDCGHSRQFAVRGRGAIKASSLIAERSRDLITFRAGIPVRTGGRSWQSTVLESGFSVTAADCIKGAQANRRAPSRSQRRARPRQASAQTSFPCRPAPARSITDPCLSPLLRGRPGRCSSGQEWRSRFI